jgi:putative chitinase
MDYDKAEKIRNKSFGSLLGEQEGGLGASLKSAISQKTQAKMTGIKEKFDPMNIARAVGGKTGAAVYGKVFGRDQKSMERFAGAKKKRISEVDGVGKASGDSSPADVLGLIYRMMLRNAEDDKLQNELKQNKKEEEDKEENDRNQQLIRALTGRKKEPTRKEKKAERRAERKEEKKVEAKAKKEAKPKVKPAKEEAPKAPAKTPEKPPAKAPEKPKVEKAPEKPKVEKAPEKPKVEKAPEKPPAKAPEKPTAAPAPKPEVKPPTAAPAAKPPIIGTAAGKLGGAAGLVVSALVSSGIVSSKAQANILSQVKSESNFVPKSEILFYTKAEGIQNTFGKGRIPTLEFAQQFVSKKGDDRSEQLANHVYAKTDGNSAPGDGWKYRGRGFLQVTGKNAYKSLGDYLKVDLVSNPDLLNNPEIAAKSIPWFFLNYKKYLTKGDPKSLEDIGLVNKAVGFSDPTGEKAKKRAELSSEIQSMDLNSGSQIDQASKENKDLKADMANKDKSPIIVNNNTTNTQKNSNAETNKQTIDDRSAYQKKAQG